jgi:hypothetical protein
MDFLLIGGGNVIPGKMREFQTWVRANSATLAKLAAEHGYQLVGVYVSIFTSEKHSGACKTIWRLDSYGALDRMAAATSKPSDLSRLIDEMDGFFDVRIGSDWSGELLKSVSDATITSDHPEA